MRFRPLSVLGLALLFGSAALAAGGSELPTAKPESVGMSSERLARLNGGMKSLVDQGRLAGVVTMVARHGKVVEFDAVGKRYDIDDRGRRFDLLDAFGIGVVSRHAFVAQIIFPFSALERLNRDPRLQECPLLVDAPRVERR